MKSLVLSFICCFLFITLLSTSCKKSTVESDNSYGLPNATQTGAGLFAFHMNGTNYTVKNSIYKLGAGIYKDTVAVRGFFDYGYFFGGFYIGTAANAKLNIPYDLSDTIHTYCLFVTDSTCQQVVRTSSFKTKSGQITLTKVDSVQKIISGVFSINVSIPNCESLIVTSGRFDCRYQ